MNGMACQQCNGASEYEKFCYDCALDNKKCVTCGMEQFTHFIVCKQCMINEHGKCEQCYGPNDASGTCSIGCQV